MSDVRALILTIVGTGVAATTIVITVLSMQIGAVNTRIDDMRDDIRELRADHVRFEERLDAIEVALAEVEQRLATLERVVFPAREPAGN